MLTPKTYYTISELANLIGMHRRTCNRMLRRVGILQTVGGSGRHLIWLSDIQSAMPEMYASMVEQHRLREMSAAPLPLARTPGETLGRQGGSVHEIVRRQQSPDFD